MQKFYFTLFGHHGQVLINALTHFKSPILLLTSKTPRNAKRVCTLYKVGSHALDRSVVRPPLDDLVSCWLATGGLLVGPWCHASLSCPLPSLRASRKGRGWHHPHHKCSLFALWVNRGSL